MVYLSVTLPQFFTLLISGELINVKSDHLVLNNLIVICNFKNFRSDPKSDDQFRYMITALKIYHRLGLKMQNNSVYGQKDGVAAESNKGI